MIHHVFANKSNVGDWLSARGIQALLDCPITEHLCDEPFIPTTLAALQQLRPDDLIVIGGGGLFMDYFVEFWEGFREIAQRVPFCIWGVGYCHMKRKDSRPPAALLHEIVSHAQLCVVRDELTREYLSGCGLSPAVPCPSMSMVEERAPGFGLLHVDAWDNVGEANYATMEAVGRAYAAETGRSFHSLNNLIPASSEKGLAGVLAHYEQADVILAGRLHGCIIGLAMGRRVLAVSGDHKLESFMNAAGLGEWVLDLREIHLLAQRLRELPLQPTARQYSAHARRRHRGIAEEIRALTK